MSKRKSPRDPYKELKEILNLALLRSSEGKGKERHNPTGNRPFIEQPICNITRSVGTGFPLGQVQKKMEEINSFSSYQSKINELLDCIVYISAAVRILQEWQEAERNLPLFPEYKEAANYIAQSNSALNNIKR